MTEKKTKGAKPNFFVRFGQGFVGFFKRIGLAVNYSVIVVLFMLFMMVIIGLLDTGATQLVNLIMSA